MADDKKTPTPKGGGSGSGGPKTPRIQGVRPPQVVSVKESKNKGKGGSSNKRRG